ncbi:hypothetical protein P43SY_003871 [Pythium insidiosum]|uniref:PTM/DIR17-like Tudor domain-containing protein n=1 Tax=Pythium insidiosum TaxID=114742 RepID=A0AAD5LZS2_PYTIN|nr:hypothetical protein P43SY_003871 [Pythium insidiosum]
MQAKRAGDSVEDPRDASREMATAAAESRDKKNSAAPTAASSSRRENNHQRADSELTSSAAAAAAAAKGSHRGEKKEGTPSPHDVGNNNSSSTSSGAGSNSRSESSKAAAASAARASSRPRSRSPSASPRSPSASGGSGGDLSDDEMSNDGREPHVAPAAASSMSDRRNSTLTLPSLSRAALMHMSDRSDASSRAHQGRPDSLDDARASPLPSMDKRQFSSDHAAARYPGGSSANDTRYERRNHSAADSGGAARWPRRDRESDPIDRERDDMGSNHSGEGGPSRGDDAPEDFDDDMEDGPPPSPGRDGHDVRIMFHGREISAIDLVGLRVAKTFVGHGRFLGQVVKFDERSSQYTIVYADGDAEDLSIENTIQILIQDEIERADPSLPPLAVPYRTEERFLAPPGNFRGAGRIFTSALDVVELIATDNEMLSLCFPQNVHSAILSLFPEPSIPRKRATNSTPPCDLEGYDMKRQRQGRDDLYSAGEWQDVAENIGRGGTRGYMGGRGAMPMHRGDPGGPTGDERGYYGDRSMSRASGMRAGGGPIPSSGGTSGADTPPMSYRGYRDLKPNQSGQYSPGHESFAHRYASAREPPLPDYRVGAGLSHGTSSSGGPPQPAIKALYMSEFKVALFLFTCADGASHGKLFEQRLNSWKAPFPQVLQSSELCELPQYTGMHLCEARAESLTLLVLANDVADGIEVDKPRRLYGRSCQCSSIDGFADQFAAPV